LTARWALISFAGANVATGTLVACIMVSIIVTPVVDRLHLPFAALGFSAVVSMMPGFFLFQAASALVELVSVGPRAPVTLLTSIVGEWRHGISDHPGHDLRADLAAHAA
jgi:hypothetical protein